MIVLWPYFLSRPDWASGDLWAARPRAVAPAPTVEAKVEFPRCKETTFFLARRNAGTGSRCRTSTSISAGSSGFDRLAWAFMTSMKRTNGGRLQFPGNVQTQPVVPGASFTFE